MSLAARLLQDAEEVASSIVVEAQCVKVLFPDAMWFLLINSFVYSLGGIVSRDPQRMRLLKPIWNVQKARHRLTNYPCSRTTGTDHHQF